MQDAALPVSQLAERVGLTQTPCWKRIQKLEAAGIVTRRVAVVEPALIGLRLTARPLRGKVNGRIRADPDTRPIDADFLFNAADGAAYVEP